MITRTNIPVVRTSTSAFCKEIRASGSGLQGGPVTCAAAEETRAPAKTKSGPVSVSTAACCAGFKDIVVWDE